MSVRAPEASGTDIKSISVAKVGSTATLTVTQAPAGNTLTMIEAINDVRDLRREAIVRDEGMAHLEAGLDQVRQGVNTLDHRVDRLPGKTFVVLVALILAALGAAVAGIVPEIVRNWPFWG